MIKRSNGIVTNTLGVADSKDTPFEEKREWRDKIDAVSGTLSKNLQFESVEDFLKKGKKNKNN